MRDLSGRRIRHVEDEKKLQEWLAKKETEKQEEMLRVENEKFVKMEERRSQTADVGHELDETANAVSSAVSKGLAKTGGKVFTSPKVEDEEQPNKRKRTEEPSKPVKKKKNMFATEFDDVSSDSESEEK
ncbi:hypothetical protein AKO1_014946 [Acrasis kona]